MEHYSSHVLSYVASAYLVHVFRLRQYSGQSFHYLHSFNNLSYSHHFYCHPNVQSNLLRKCSEWQRSFTARSGNVSTEASLCDMIGFAFLYMKTEESDHEECNT